MANVPTTPEPAATVILLREGPVSPEVLMIERHSKSEFLPDLYVFPGGRVEEQDHALADRVAGMTRGDAARLATTVPARSAQAFFVAAIRETFEEAGILLARRRGETELIRLEQTGLERHRLGLQAGKTPFREIVESYDLELAAHLLAVHAHWITPRASPRRYDTLFFTAMAPRGQVARHDGIEATNHVWIRPEDALEQLQVKKRRIILPTALNLETLSGFGNCEDALEASRQRPVVPVTPEVVDRDGRPTLVIPKEAGYSLTEAPAE